MDVINADQVRSCAIGCYYMVQVRYFQARIAEEAGACAVMALERVPADIRAEGPRGSVTSKLLFVDPLL